MLFASEDGATWTAVAMSCIAAAVSIASAINARKRDRDARELENQRERDKRLFDSKILRLEERSRNCEEDRDGLAKRQREMEAERERDRLEWRQEVAECNERYEKVMQIILQRQQEMDEIRRRPDESSSPDS